MSQDWLSLPPGAVVDETGKFKGEFIASVTLPALSSAYSGVL